MPKTFNLYSTDGCHLCEQALELIITVNPNIKVTVLDIMDDPTWLETFQIRIPVLEPTTNKLLERQAQLDWPFDKQQLLDFFRQHA
ncbi:MAG: glutaredoxin family protein [Saccharospirillaceae bacterium]|nr:glutaredoxin family protein [Pseudomonadales bacterium]NRB80687.1 glutaredoxin family protein [Saccharospirillaceae bacterium]